MDSASATLCARDSVDDAKSVVYSDLSVSLADSSFCVTAGSYDIIIGKFE